jgi:hypothetical protein
MASQLVTHQQGIKVKPIAIEVAAARELGESPSDLSQTSAVGEQLRTTRTRGARSWQEVRAGQEL